MASRGFSPINSVNRGEVEIGGSFATLSGNGAIITIAGKGFTMTNKAATGIYVVVFDDIFPTFIGCQLQLQLNTADSWRCQMKSFVPSTKTLTLRIVDETAAEVDVADNANNRINFSVKFLNVT